MPSHSNTFFSNNLPGVFHDYIFQSYYICVLQLPQQRNFSNCCRWHPFVIRLQPKQLHCYQHFLNKQHLLPNFFHGNYLASFLISGFIYHTISAFAYLFDLGIIFHRCSQFASPKQLAATVRNYLTIIRLTDSPTFCRINKLSKDTGRLCRSSEHIFYKKLFLFQNKNGNGKLAANSNESCDQSQQVAMKLSCELLK